MEVKVFQVDVLKPLTILAAVTDRLFFQRDFYKSARHEGLPPHCLSKQQERRRQLVVNGLTKLQIYPPLLENSVHTTSCSRGQ